MRNFFAGIAAACLVAFLAFTVPASASMHTAIERDATLLQITNAATAAKEQNLLPAPEAATVLRLVSELKEAPGAVTPADFEKLEQIRDIFAAHQVESVTLDGAVVFVAEAVKELRHMYVHTEIDHNGFWQLE